MTTNDVRNGSAGEDAAITSLQNASDSATPTPKADAVDAPAVSAEGSGVAPAAPASADGDSGDDSDADDAPGDGAAEGGEGAQAAAGEGKKRKRRRRKKKKPEGAVDAAAGAEGAPAGDAAAAATGDKPAGDKPAGKRDRNKKKGDKPKESRERPPFNLGDIVFGKVISVEDDVLFVDLSGKATGLFDLRELLIPEEEARAAAEAKARSEAAAGDAVVESPAADESVQAPAEQPAAAEAEPVAAPAEPEAAAEPVAAEATETSSDDTDLGDDGLPAESPAPALPRVILEPGAQFVGVVHNDGGRGGLVVLTHHPERVSKAKSMAAQASKDGSLVYGIVTGVIKGGVEVDVDGLRAFTPASHMDLRLGADLSHFVGQRLAFAVTQYGKRGRDVVLSRRAMLESEAQEKRATALAHLTVGEEAEGTVRTVVPFGAFIDLGGIEGLVPLSEMSHNRADRPSDVFKVGETVRVKILKIDEKGKLWLSRRATVADPWAAVREKYSVGSRHTGKVARLHSVGAFIELEPGIDGLIRRADLSFKRGEEAATEEPKEGDEIAVVVAHVDGGAHRIALHPALTGDAADEAPQKIALHRSVKVKVVQPESGGLVVRILGVTGWQARGYVPASATGTPRGTELRKDFPVGKELEVKVLDIDPRKNEVRLSLRALAEDNERQAYQQYRQQVKREAKFGTFADLLAKAGKTST